MERCLNRAHFDKELAQVMESISTNNRAVEVKVDGYIYSAKWFGVPIQKNVAKYLIANID